MTKYDKHISQSMLLSVPAILLCLMILPAFAADITSISSQDNSTKDVTINLTAKNYAFNTSTIAVPAGANVTINFDNMDAGEQHNFAVYETAEANKKIFVGDDITGPSKITYNFEAPIKAGMYLFRCDDHAGQMKGNFIVK